MNKAIVILAGGFTRDASGEWHSSPFGAPATVSMSGSYVRITAAAMLAKRDKDAIVVPSGGRGQADKLFPPGLFLSTVMKRELVLEGVPESSILEENQSGNTLQQLREIVRLTQEHRWPWVKIVSSRFHLPRIRAMIEYLEIMETLRLVVEYVSAEEVVLSQEPDEWRTAIDTAYASDEFQQLMELEVRGVKQLQDGTYRMA